MDDLISRAALLNGYDVCKVTEYDESGCGVTYMAVSVGAIKNAPAVDAEPVRHGRWREVAEGEGGHLMECSVCKEWLFHNFDYVSNYCPNCGAKMDGDANATD